MRPPRFERWPAFEKPRRRASLRCDTAPYAKPSAQQRCAHVPRVVQTLPAQTEHSFAHIHCVEVSELSQTLPQKRGVTRNTTACTARSAAHQRSGATAKAKNVARHRSPAAAARASTRPGRPCCTRRGRDEALCLLDCAKSAPSSEPSLYKLCVSLNSSSYFGDDEDFEPDEL